MNDEAKEGHPLKRRYSTAIGSSNVTSKALLTQTETRNSGAPSYASEWSADFIRRSFGYSFKERPVGP